MYRLPLGLVMVLVASTVSAQVPAGPQFQVNAYTTNKQAWAAVTIELRGGFIVVWEGAGSNGSDNDPLSGDSVHLQRFDVAGGFLGAELQVNIYTSSHQRSPVVAIDSLGNFVVVWDSFGSSESDSDGQSIQGMRFASDGTPLAAEFQVNSYTAGYQVRPSVGMDPPGNFVVVWDSFSSNGTDSYITVQGQLYDSDGAEIGAQFQVNTYTTYGQRFGTVAMDPAGNFVVVWESYGSGGSDTDRFSVSGQRFVQSPGQTPQPVGSEFQVNTYTSSDQRFPGVAMNSVGNFVVVWASYGSSGSDTASSSVQGQLFDSSSNPIGNEIQVNVYTTSFQGFPEVQTGADDEFVVIWASSASATDSSSGSIQGLRFSSGGNPLGDQFQVNTYTTGGQSYPAVAMTTAGDFAVVWRSEGSNGTDSSQSSIQAQRYQSGTIFIDGFESGNTLQWSNSVP